MRCAFLIAYDGSGYFGFVRQPGKPTVEGELLKAFGRLRFYRELKDSWYRVAARTDRGVSALGQVVALNTLRVPDLEEINSALPDDIAVLCVRGVRESFDPRAQALIKHYRYVCRVPAEFDFASARDAAKSLEGQHDFRCFCKREPGKGTRGAVLHAGIERRGDLLAFDFVAPAFLRQQVRRMVSGVLDVGTGGMDSYEFRTAVEGRAEHSLRPVPPDGLFLVSIGYRRPFKPVIGASEKFMRYLGTRRDLRSREMLGVLERGIRLPPFPGVSF